VLGFLFSFVSNSADFFVNFLINLGCLLKKF
jgi:hypothetical protein